MECEEGRVCCTNPAVAFIILDSDCISSTGVPGIKKNDSSCSNFANRRFYPFSERKQIAAMAGEEKWRQSGGICVEQAGALGQLPLPENRPTE